MNLLYKLKQVYKNLIIIVFLIFALFYFLVDFDFPISLEIENSNATLIFNDIPYMYFNDSSRNENDFEFSFDYETLIKKFGLEKKRLIALPYVSGNTFNGLARYSVNGSTLKNFKPNKVLCADIIWIKSDYVEDFYNKYHDRIPYPYIIITHNSDYSAPPGGGEISRNLIKYLNDPKLIAWFGENKIIE